MPKNDKFQNKVSIISGGAGGIGLATANELASEGAKIIILDSNKKALEELYQFNNAFDCIYFDFTSNVHLSELIEDIWKTYGRIDSFIACTGISPKSMGRKVKFTEISEDDWDLIMSINVKSSFLCAKYISPYMIEQKEGSMVFISSMAGRTTSSTAALHYITSKAAILGLTKGLASELAPHGIRVNCISPGKVNTALINTELSSTSQSYLENIPLGRFADPEEIAKVISFLVSGDSSYVVGANIDINGGRIMI